MLENLIYLSLFILALGVSSCEKKGPAEKAAEKIDQAVEEAGDKIEEKTD